MISLSFYVAICEIAACWSFNILWFIDVDEASKQELRRTFLVYDRNLLIADPRRRESKKFGGPGPRARYQKSYR